MHKQWNIISRDFPGLERNPGIKIPVKMKRDPGTEPLIGTQTTIAWCPLGLEQPLLPEPIAVAWQWAQVININSN